jgi:hypothetical protein
VDVSHAATSSGLYTENCIVVVGLYTLNPVQSIARKRAWLHPLNLKCVISWFQDFAFKWVNLYRYVVAEGEVRKDGVFEVRALGGGCAS